LFKPVNSHYSQRKYIIYCFLLEFFFQEIAFPQFGQNRDSSPVGIGLPQNEHIRSGAIWTDLVNSWGTSLRVKPLGTFLSSRGEGMKADDGMRDCEGIA